VRGLTHFVSGMAVATFFPELVSDLLAGNLLPILAAASAYLPDFLDFKIKRIVEKWDYEVDPAPPDPATNLSPKIVRFGELDIARDRYRWYAFPVVVKEFHGVVKKPYQAGEALETAVYTVSDGFAELPLYIIGDDIELFKKIYGLSDLKDAVGMWIRLLGYLDVDPVDGRQVVIFSDAPHPKYIADLVAKAVEKAYEKGEVRVKFHNIRLPGDVYRKYIVHIPPDGNHVEVYMGPIVSLGGNPVTKDLPPKHRFSAKSTLTKKVVKTYPFPVSVSGFSGPSVAYRRDGDVVEEVFIPWHRGFSHSFVCGALVGLVVAGLFKLLGYTHALALGLATMLGHWMHVIEDQLGYMGSVLLPPLTKKRVRGLMLGRAGSGWLNFATMYLMFALMAWNFTRYVPDISRALGLSNPNMVLYAGIIPSIIAYVVGILSGWKERKRIKEIMKQYREVAPFEELEEELSGG